MKFATALTLFTASSAMKLKLSKEFDAHAPIEDVLATKLSELSTAQHACTKTELEAAIARHTLAPKAAQQLREDFAKYIAQDRTVRAVVEELLHPLGEEGGMTEQSERAELEAMIDSVWNCY